MSAVLLTPPYLQFLTTDGTNTPLAFGTVTTYAAGTTTKKATYTDASGVTPAPNPIQLNAAGIPQTGNGGIWITGSYDIVVKDQFGVTIDTQPNITSFNNTVTATSPLADTFSGNGAQTSFTLSQNLGTDPKTIMVFVAAPTAGFFQKFSGTGSQTVFSLSAAKGTDSTSLQVYVYNAALGDKLGFELQDPSAYTISANTLTFTVAPVTGTSNIYVSQPTIQNTNGIAGVLPPSAYTLNGTSLTFAIAPVTGTNNIIVFAPTTLVGAAALSAAAADASATTSANSAAAAASSASSAAAFAQAKVTWNFSTTTTMANPGTGFLRFNNATISSVTAAAISNLSADSGNPDLSNWIATWDDAPASPRGEIFLFKDNANFVIFNITGANVDNSGWKQLTLTYVASSGTIANADVLRVGFVAYGATTVTGGITALTGDVTASGSGSVAATIASNAVTTAKILDNNVTLAKLATQAANTVLANATGSTAVPTAVALSASTILGRGSSGNIVGLTAGTGITIGASTISTTSTGGLQPQMTVFTSSGTFTTSANITTSTKFRFTVTGGGGGGGGGGGTTGQAGGGGAGGTAIYLVSGLTASTGYTVVVGTGGAAQSNGVDSTIVIGATTVTGVKGLLGTDINATTTGAGGLGGAATNGTINISGGDGAGGSVITASAGTGGLGGASYHGGGGRGGDPTSGATGQVGKAYGSGGGGGSNNGTGGAGKAGIVIAEWFE